MSGDIDLYYVHLFNDYSGSPRVLRDAIEAKINNANNTYVFTSKHKGFLDGVKAKRVNCFYARSNNRFIQLFYFLLSQFLLLFQLFSYLTLSKCRGRKSTVVINTMLPFGAGLASKLMSDKTIYYVHETFIKPDQLKKFLRFFVEHCASHVIFVSRYLQSEEAFTKPIQNVIYNGLRSDFPVRKEVNYKQKFEGKELFFAGSLKIYKGIEQLLILAESLPEFKVIAAINSELDELDTFIRGHSVPDNVTFIVRPNDIQSYFNSSFLVMNLSLPDGWVETFGLSIIEGMAFGSPIIAPPVGGPVEFVNKDNGLLVDSRQINKIVDFIYHLNSSIDVWKVYSSHSLASSKNFSNEKYRENFRLYAKTNELV